jgi:hypothetical protein
MTESAPYEALFNEASHIADELNTANHQRCALLTWICALKMAAKLIQAKHAHFQPEQAANLAAEIEHIDEILAEMTILLIPGQAEGNIVRAHRINNTEPRDRS